jgi:hypothetical protein
MAREPIALPRHFLLIFDSTRLPIDIEFNRVYRYGKGKYSKVVVDDVEQGVARQMRVSFVLTVVQGLPGRLLNYRAKDKRACFFSHFYASYQEIPLDQADLSHQIGTSNQHVKSARFMTTFGSNGG